MIQFSLLSLIPGLLSNLQDCADPAFDSYAENAEKATSLKTSERSSCMCTTCSRYNTLLLIAWKNSTGLYGVAITAFRQGGLCTHTENMTETDRLVGKHIWTLYTLATAGSAG